MGKQKKEEAEEEKEEPIKAQNSTVKVKKKKVQPAFVVGKFMLRFKGIVNNLHFYHKTLI